MDETRTETLSGPEYGPASGGRACSLVVLLHGIGADGNDLIGLVPHWAPVLPDTVFVSPHAPFPCDMAPFGRQWFSLADRAPPVLLEGARRAAPVLDSFLDAELARRGLSDDSLVLMGFSQGTMMALHVGLRRPRACAGILGYSGALLGAETLPAEIRARPPVLLVHGDMDPVVPFAAHAPAVQALRAAGIEVESVVRPGLGHGIDEEGVRLGARFLAARLAPAGV